MLENVLTGSIPLRSVNNEEVTSATNRSNTNQEKMNENVDEKIKDTDKVKDTDEIKSIVSDLNEMTEPLRTNLQFQAHEKLDEYYVEVVNTSTDEVIKEIPPKQMLDKYAAMAEHMGLLVDDKV